MNFAHYLHIILGIGKYTDAFREYFFWWWGGGYMRGSFHGGREFP